MHKALQKKYTGSQGQQQDPDDGAQSGNSPNTIATDPHQNSFNDNTHNAQAQNAPQSNYAGTSGTNYGGYTGMPSNSKSLQETVSYLEQHNCPKSGIRFTSDFFPNTRRAVKSSKYPLAAIVQPYATVYAPEHFPVVSFGPNQNIIRCHHCRAYINPFVKFFEDGAKFHCNLCNSQNAVPNHYYANLVNGERVDKHDRVELSCGIYDIKAGTEYMARPPVPPTFVFLLDVSKEAVQSGMLGLAANALHELITEDQLPGGNRAQIAIMAYDSCLHYFALNPKMKFPQLVSLPDPQDFSGPPLPDDIIINVVDMKALILSLLSSLPTMFAKNASTGSCLSQALQSVGKAIGRIGGRLFVLQASGSVLMDPALKLKTSPQSLDKKQLFIPTGPDVSNQSIELHQHFIQVNLFVFSDTYKNFITMSDYSRLTAGEAYYYPSSNERSQKFFYEFKNTVIKDTTWEAVFRLRVSRGWKIVNRVGNYSIKSSDLLSVPCLDENKTLLYEFDLDDEVARTSVVYIQSALLYTNTNGERRIRIINYGVPLTENTRDVFTKADAQALCTVLYRRSLQRLYQVQDTNTIRTELMQVSSEIVKEMTRECKLAKAGTYIDSMATFPLIILGLAKGLPLSISGISATKEMDYRNALRTKLNSTSVDETMLIATPYLFSLTSMVDEDTGSYDEEGNFVFPNLMSLTYQNLSNDGLYLLDDGLNLYLLVGSQTSSQVLSSMFNIQNLTDVQKLTEENMYSNMEDPLVERVSNLISELRGRRNESYSYLYVIKEGEKSPEEFEFYLKLVEDKVNHPNTYAMSYAEFANKLHMGQ